MEAQTAGRLRTLAETSGIDAGADEAPRTDGIGLAESARDQPWYDFLRSLRSALPSYLENFERLQALGAPGDPILAELVAHERAIDRFAELEGEGRSAEAIAVLRGHLNTSRAATPRA